MVGTRPNSLALVGFCPFSQWKIHLKNEKMAQNNAKLAKIILFKGIFRCKIIQNITF